MQRFFSSPLRLTILIIGGLLTAHALLWAGGRFLDGYPSELCQKIQGFSVTPFFMEFGFVAFGFIAILAVNYFRRKWEGDELVYLEIVDEPNVQLPSRSRSAVFPEHHTHDDLKTKLALIEGSLAVKDYDQARELCGGLTTDELENPEVRSLIASIPKKS